MKGHRFTKAVSLMLSAAMAASMLAACAGTQGTQSASGETPAQSTGSQTASGEKITLRLVHCFVGSATKTEWMQWLIERFNEEYGDEIELEIEEIAGEDEMIEKMKVYLSTDELPDITPYGVNISYDLAVAGKTWDLTPYLDASPDIKAGLTQASIEQNSYDGKIFGLPISTSWMFMYANKDLFEQAGVDTQFDTWEDFWDTLDALKASGIEYPVAMETAGNAWTSGLYLGGLIAGASEEGFAFMNTANPQSFDNDAVRTGMEEVTRLLREYAAPDALGGDYAAAEAHFMNEEAALLINGTWVISHFSDPELVSDPSFEDKIVPVAFPEDMIYKSANYGFTICSKDQAHADAAWKFLELAASEESQAMMMYYSGDLPENAAVELDEDTQEKYPLLAQAFEQFGESKAIQGYTRLWSTAIVDELAANLPALVYESMTPDQVIERLDAAAAASG